MAETSAGDGPKLDKNKLAPLCHDLTGAVFYFAEKNSMKKAVKRCVAVFILAVLITNAVYTAVYRFAEPTPATRWLPLYDWIYNTTNK